MPNYVTNLDKDTGQGKRAVVHYTTGAQAFEVLDDVGRLLGVAVHHRTGGLEALAVRSTSRSPWSTRLAATSRMSR